MLRRAIAASRYVVVLAIGAIGLLATAILAYGVALTVRIVAGPLRDGVGETSTKQLIIGAIEAVDLFLLGVTLYVIALGLYELFIDPNLPTSPWLRIRDLDDLKGRVLGIVIVVLGVFFLGQALAWDGTRDLLPLGGASALVIAALTYFLNQKSAGGDKPK